MQTTSSLPQIDIDFLLAEVARLEGEVFGLKKKTRHQASLLESTIRIMKTPCVDLTHAKKKLSDAADVVALCAASMDTGSRVVS